MKTNTTHPDKMHHRSLLLAVGDLQTSAITNTTQEESKAMKPTQIIAATVMTALFLAAAPAKVQAALFTDNTFNNADWTSTVLLLGNGGSVSAGQVGSGGNPGSYRSVTNSVNPAGASASIVHGYHLSPLMTYSFLSSGAIASMDFSFDHSVAGFDVGVGLAIQQNGNVFYGGYTIASGTPWHTLSASGLHSSDFVGPPGGVLDFSATALPIELGFLTATSNNPFGRGYSATIGIDNFSVNVTSVPEPATLAVGLLCLGVGMARRRRA